MPNPKAEIDIVVKHHGFERGMAVVRRILGGVKKAMLAVAATAAIMLTAGIGAAVGFVRAFAEQEAAGPG